MTRLFLFVALVCIASSTQSQTNVRAWYADGQVWIVWNYTLPLPQTVGVYASSIPISNTGGATLIGRPFHLDYLASALIEQTDTTATYRIPDANGGRYQLAHDEALFVFTPHQDGLLYFAVVPWEETQITAGENITDTAISFGYDPVHDPVECHLQSAFPSPFTTGYTCFAFYMWVDGRDNHLDGRPDFPIMANAAKNGMAGFFFISVPNGLDTLEPFPLSVWLHGGGGVAMQSLAGSRKETDIDPHKGILLAHNDDLFGRKSTVPAFIDNPSWHFGWRKNWDPFTEDNLPTEVDTVINYTQRRYLWIDQWLIWHYNIDTASIHIHGHSMGSSGTTALAKAYPEHYASATIFNNGCRGHTPGSNISALFGDATQNFPTNLKNRNGETVRFLELFDLITNISPQRDLPVFRSYHSKNDIGDTNYWGEDVVENYRTADAIGHGMALSWSERAHGPDTGPDYNDHWISGIPPDQQTAADNVDWTEAHSRADISYPAFFNHRLDPNANDPGDGTPGTGASGVGDDWGTWGGWHRWDNATLIDEPGQWSIEAWLESEAVFDHDNCPVDHLSAYLAIRKPVKFKPLTGEILSWQIEDVNSGLILQSGTVFVNADGLVVVPDVNLYREDIRKVNITITNSAVAIHDVSSKAFSPVVLFPNPSEGNLSFRIDSKNGGNCLIRLLTHDLSVLLKTGGHLQPGINDIPIRVPVALCSGVYVVEIITEENRYLARWVKM